jgi:hypothetical protein
MLQSWSGNALALPIGPVPACAMQPVAWSRPVLVGFGQGPQGRWWSGPAAQHAHGLGVGVGVGAQHVGQCGPHARTRTGRQDTMVVTAHGARAIPA